MNPSPTPSNTAPVAEIVLQAGPSSIVLGPTGITLFGPIISLN